MVFNDRELAIVLAGLRLLQMQRDRDIPGGVLGIATCEGTVERLSDDEIDALCERLNTSDTE